MGLDISLYKIDDLDKKLRLEKQGRDETNRYATVLKNKYTSNWHNSEEASSLFETFSQETYKKLGLNKFGEFGTHDKVELDSKLHPKHMFKVGYLRSSYNEAGINNVLRRMTDGKDLYYIFFGSSGNDDYYVKPDWQASLVRAKEVLETFSKLCATETYDVECEEHNIFWEPTVKDAAEALAVFKRQAEKIKASNETYDYSNRDGKFFMSNPLPVLAAIPGFGPLKQPCVYLVYNKDPEDLIYYKEALEITVEMCEWVLTQPDVDKYYLGWSG